MNIRSIPASIFAILLFMGLTPPQNTAENGMVIYPGFIAAASAEDHKDKTKDKTSSAPLVCQCKAVADAKDKADKADKASKAAKDSKDKADKDKYDIDHNKSASDKDKKDAKDKAEKADKDYKDAKDSKDKADKDEKAISELVKTGSPCTCPDGSSGFWGTDPSGGGSGGVSSGSPAPEVFRELHGN